MTAPFAMEMVLGVAPTAQQRPRHARLKTKSGGSFDATYKSATQKANEAELDAELRRYLPMLPRDDTSLALPVSLDIECLMPIPTSTSARKAGDMIRCPCLRHVDVDNLCKQLFDRMTALGFWKDDSVVYDVRIVKLWAVKGGWKVRFKRMGDEQWEER